MDWENLGDAYKMTQKYYRDYPKSDHAKYISAVMKGDYSELLSAGEEDYMKSEGVKQLFSIMEVLGTIPRTLQKFLRNEYYYHSGQFLNQYLLGCEQLTRGNAKSGHFSIGVGGSEYAYKLLLERDLAQARYFAQKAASSWEEHAKLSPKRPFPYPYFYLQALVIDGKAVKAKRFYTELKKEKRYRLKKPIYVKYDRRFERIKKIVANGE